MRHIRPREDWTEMQVTRAFCDKGCKLYVRAGEKLEAQVMHNATYSCSLALDPETAVIRVELDLLTV